MSDFTRVSRIPKILSNFREAQQKGLQAGAYVIANAVKRKLRGGYTSSLGNHGDFVTGNSLNHVTIGEPQGSGDGAFILVGTDLLYDLYWEVGHYNLFTRHFERDEKWRPAAEESRADAYAAFQRVFSRFAFTNLA